ncbi:heavy metal-associated domain-containing protein [Rhodanobacter sp. 115]|nr:heavy metal-associated domain-containing protein [Rhodanobacter sp. 115]EIL86803.1 hypothetical protein UU5_20895 [Rhodanobacter sp. 115]
MNEQTLSVTGMTCADCARHVEKALKTLTDIVVADVATHKVWRISAASSH